MPIHKVKSNLDPNDVNQLLINTFAKWVNFALGKSKIGGKAIKVPSGRYASALRAEKDKDGNLVALYLDKESLDEGRFPLSGHKGFSLKSKMLQAGKPGVKRSKKGNLYRYVPISESPPNPVTTFFMAEHIKNILTGKKEGENTIISINKNLSRMWVAGYKRSHKMQTKIRTMSYKSGSARWYIPAMPAFNAAKLFRDSLPKGLKDKIKL